MAKHSNHLDPWECLDSCNDFESFLSSCQGDPLNHELNFIIYSLKVCHRSVPNFLLKNHSLRELILLYHFESDFDSIIV